VQNDVLSRIEDARINRMTPLQALNLLADLQASLQSGAFPVDRSRAGAQGELFSG
jgi:hypothetical protein